MPDPERRVRISLDSISQMKLFLYCSLYCSNDLHVLDNFRISASKNSLQILRATCSFVPPPKSNNPSLSIHLH